MTLGQGLIWAWCRSAGLSYFISGGTAWESLVGVGLPVTHISLLDFMSPPPATVCNMELQNQVGRNLRVNLLADFGMYWTARLVKARRASGRSPIPATRGSVVPRIWS